MKIELVKSNGNYVGCKMIATKTKEEISLFQFYNGVEIEKSGYYIKADCQQLIGFVIKDSRQVTANKGFSTCGALYPCLSCLWNLTDRQLPLQVKKYGTKRKSDDSDGSDKSNVYKFMYTNYTEQTGDNNLAVCFKNFEKNVAVEGGPFLLN